VGQLSYTPCKVVISAMTA